jgi:hypothetical protein
VFAATAFGGEVREGAPSGDTSVVAAGTSVRATVFLAPRAPGLDFAQLNAWRGTSIDFWRTSMFGKGGPFPITRRSALLLAGAGLTGWVRLDAAAAEFWEKKPPSEWTSEEIDRLISKSPWAKEVTAEYAPESGSGSAPSSGGASGNGRPRVGIGGIPGLGGRGGRGNRGGERQGGASSYKGTVRWESAKPILEAMKAPLPEQFVNHYVISVNGIPLLGGGHPTSQGDGDGTVTRRPSEDDPYDNLKQFTTLQPKGRDLVQAGVVHRQVSTGTNFLFGFSSELLPLSADDGEAVFSTRLGQLTVKARFSFKEMLYHRELAL